MNIEKDEQIKEELLTQKYKKEGLQKRETNKTTIKLTNR